MTPLFPDATSLLEETHDDLHHLWHGLSLAPGV